MTEDYLNVLVLFMMICVGYFLSVKKIFSEQTNKMFTILLLNVSLPLMLIINIRGEFSKNEFLTMLSYTKLPLLNIVLLSILSGFAVFLFKINKKRRGLFTNVCAMSSTIFFGIPITLAIFGEKGLPYGLIYYISQTLLYWTVAIVILKLDINQTSQVENKFNIKELAKNIFSMPFIGFIIGTFLLLENIKIPIFLEKFSNYLGNMTAPIAMLLIGGLLYLTDFKKLVLNRDVFIVLMFRFVIAPISALVLGTLLNTDLDMLKVTIIMSALPIPNSTVILVNQYKTDSNFAATVLTYSTLIFLIYLPILLWVIRNIVMIQLIFKQTF